MTYSPSQLVATADEVEAARRQAVHDALRRLPNVLAVYETTTAAALALLIGYDAPLRGAIAEDVWHGLRQNWPRLGAKP